jgi:VIT1/CCC1 family predicted Fe2+/Mn2+ transporter
MVQEEYGMAPLVRSPAKAGLCTFSAFALFGSIPLVPYLAGGDLLSSAVAASAAFLMIGSLKSRWTVRSAWRSGLETLVIGGIAAIIAFATGHFLARLLS